jgi:hypothetical protein
MGLINPKSSTPAKIKAIARKTIATWLRGDALGNLFILPSSLIFFI